MYDTGNGCVYMPFVRRQSGQDKYAGSVNGSCYMSYHAAAYLGIAILARRVSLGFLRLSAKAKPEVFLDDSGNSKWKGACCGLTGGDWGGGLCTVYFLLFPF